MTDAGILAVLPVINCFYRAGTGKEKTLPVATLVYKAHSFIYNVPKAVDLIIMMMLMITKHFLTEDNCFSISQNQNQNLAKPIPPIPILYKTNTINTNTISKPFVKTIETISILISILSILYQYQYFNTNTISKPTLQHQNFKTSFGIGACLKQTCSFIIIHFITNHTKYIISIC
jgi:hypothetical protein